MDWLTSLPVGLLVGRVARVALLDRLRPPGGSWFGPSCRRASTTEVHGVAAPLMPALGAAFAVHDGADAGERGRIPAVGAGHRQPTRRRRRRAWPGRRPARASNRTRSRPPARLPPGHARRPSGRRQRRRTATRRRWRRSRRWSASSGPRPPAPSSGTPASTELLASLDGVTTAGRASPPPPARSPPSTSSPSSPAGWR